MVFAGALLWRGRLYRTPWILWPILLSFPLPYIANTAGWMTAEIGRQPWLVYGLLRTGEGYSIHIGTGTALFTLLGFLGLYSVLSILWVVIVYTIIQHGPESPERSPHSAAAMAAS
jgi:cytochrome bd ubiquinol oxidase subunit I